MEQVAVTVKMDAKYLFRYMMLNSTYGIVNKLVWGISLLCLILFPFSFFFGNTMTVLALGIIVFMNVIMKPVNFMARAKQQMLSNPLFKEPMYYRFDGDGIELNESDEKMFWDQLIGVKETNNMFLLYIQPLQAFVIPKEAFGRDGDLAKFKNLMKAHILGVKKLKK